MVTKLIPYQLPNSQKELNVYKHEDNYWMTLSCMSRLFNTSTLNIYIALKELSNDERFDLLNMNKQLEITLPNGKKSIGNFYNLDVIMAIGYKLNPKETTEFRLWTQFMTKSENFSQMRQNHKIVNNFKSSLTRLLSA